jgi:hypothetical protein
VPPSSGRWLIGKLLPDYTALQPRRQPTSYSPPWKPQILILSACFQLPYMLSCVSPHLFELLKKLFGAVHDTTMESLRNLQPYPVLRMKCSASHDSDVSHERVALDGDFLRYLHRILFFCMLYMYIHCLLTITTVSQEKLWLNEVKSKSQEPQNLHPIFV